MRIINSTDLNHWADHKSSQTCLPSLIRDLIKCTCKDIKYIRIPSGDRVNMSGYDGVLEINEKYMYLPKGISVIEMSTNKQIISKANSDYNKRTENPLNVSPEETNFIFITPRPWDNRYKEPWINEKKAEGVWKDVLVIDGVDLEEWLDDCEFISLRLAEWMDKNYNGLESLENWWKNWKNFGKFSIDENLLLVNRENDKKKFLEFINDKNINDINSICIQSLTPDESIAFVASVFSSLDEDKKEEYFSKAIVVNNVKSFKELTNTKNDLILIINFNHNDLNIHRNHTLIYIHNFNNNCGENKIKLSNAFKYDFKNVILTYVKEKEDLAIDYTIKSGSSVSVLRNLFVDLNNPDWVKEYKFLIPALFVQSWDESNEIDKSIIEQLCNGSFVDFLREMNELTGIEKAPIENVGDLWFVRSPFNLFMLIANKCINEDFVKLKQIIFKYYDNKNGCSSCLKKGIITTLILFSVFSDKINIKIGNVVPKFWVDDLIKELLINKSIEFWIENSYLSLIAEASPNSFLDYLEENFDELFTTESGKIFMNNINLTKALEGLAWDSKTFQRVIKLLCKMANGLDTSVFANDSKNSIKEILLPWCPKTYAPSKERMKMLDKILEDFPNLGCDILMELMPTINQISSPTHKPFYRNSHNFKPDKCMDDYDHIISKALDCCYDNAERWIKFLDSYQYIGQENMFKFNKSLSSNFDKFDKNYLLNIRDKIRKILSNSNSSDKLKLSSANYDNLNALFNDLKPDNIVDDSIWLFNHRVYPIDHEWTDFEYINNLRKDAIININEEYGFDGIKCLVEKSNCPIIICDTVVSCGINYDSYVLSELENNNKNILTFVLMYISKILLNDERLFNCVDFSGNDNNLSNFVLALPLTNKTLNLMNILDNELQNKFYSADHFNKLENDEDIERYVNKLLEFSHFNRAIEFACIFEIDVNLVFKILKEADIDKIIDHDSIPILFDRIYKEYNSTEEIINLELKYFEFLDRSNISPRYIYDKLVSNPSFFVDTILDLNTFSINPPISYDILNSFKIDSSKSCKQIYEWIKEIRNIAASKDCINLCNAFIGTILSNFFKDHVLSIECIAKIIDEIDNEDLKLHFKDGIYYSRGLYSKLPYEGGIQELKLSKKYGGYAEELKFDYPITSKLFKKLKEEYEKMSYREDDSARINHYKYDF